MFVEIRKFALSWLYLTDRKPHPTGTLRNNNVIMTSKRRRFDVIVTLLLRRVSAGVHRLDIFSDSVPVEVVSSWKFIAAQRTWFSEEQHVICNLCPICSGFTDHDLYIPKWYLTFFFILCYLYFFCISQLIGLFAPALKSFIKSLWWGSKTSVG